MPKYCQSILKETETFEKKKKVSEPPIFYMEEIGWENFITTKENKSAYESNERTNEEDDGQRDLRK